MRILRSQIMPTMEALWFSRDAFTSIVWDFLTLQGKWRFVECSKRTTSNSKLVSTESSQLLLKVKTYSGESKWGLYSLHFPSIVNLSMYACTEIHVRDIAILLANNDKKLCHLQYLRLSLSDSSPHCTRTYSDPSDSWATNLVSKLTTHAPGLMCLSLPYVKLSQSAGKAIATDLAKLASLCVIDLFEASLTVEGWLALLRPLHDKDALSIIGSWDAETFKLLVHRRHANLLQAKCVEAPRLQRIGYTRNEFGKLGVGIWDSMYLAGERTQEVQLHRSLERSITRILLEIGFPECREENAERDVRRWISEKCTLLREKGCTAVDLRGYGFPFRALIDSRFGFGELRQIGLFTNETISNISNIPLQSRPSIQIGDYLQTQWAHWMYGFCEAYTTAPSQGNGELITDIRPGSYLGPVEAIDNTALLCAVLVRGYWITAWIWKQEIVGICLAPSVHPMRVKKWEEAGWQHTCM